MAQKLEARGVQGAFEQPRKTLIPFEDGANSGTSRPPGSIPPKHENADSARGWNKFKDFEATLVDTAQAFPGSKTLISLEDGANSLISKPFWSTQPKHENADFARGWREFADLEATLVGTAQTRKR